MIGLKKIWSDPIGPDTRYELTQVKLHAIWSDPIRRNSIWRNLIRPDLTEPQVSPTQTLHHTSHVVSTAYHSCYISYCSLVYVYIRTNLFDSTDQAQSAGPQVLRVPIRSSIFSLIMEWCKLHADDPPPEETCRDDSINIQDQEFLGKLDLGTILELIKVGRIYFDSVDAVHGVEGFGVYHHFEHWHRVGFPYEILFQFLLFFVLKS